MKLSDLAPRFFTEDGNAGGSVGLTFLCPHCQAMRLGIHFRDIGHTLIGVYEPDTIHVPQGTTIWDLTGTSFADLSVTPSVDASQSDHWHGFITQGEIR